MSLNGLKIATDGYLKQTTKAVLVIAVAGYLNFGGSPIPPIPPDGGSNGGGGGYEVYKSYQAQTKDEQKRLAEEQIKMDDDLVFNIIKIWTEKIET